MELLEAFPRLIGWAVPIIVLAIIIFPQAIRVLREYERGVIFRLGKLLDCKRAGRNFPYTNRRPDGPNGSARRHHQRRETGGDDA